MEKKMYVYEVNGTNFEGFEAWGTAWEQAQALASIEHCPIFRQVVQGENIVNQVYVRGMFVRDTEEHRERAFIF